MAMCYQGAKKNFKRFGGMLIKYSNYNNLMCVLTFSKDLIWKIDSFYQVLTVINA